MERVTFSYILEAREHEFLSRYIASKKGYDDGFMKISRYADNQNIEVWLDTEVEVNPKTIRDIFNGVEKVMRLCHAFESISAVTQRLAVVSEVLQKKVDYNPLPSGKEENVKNDDEQNELDDMVEFLMNKVREAKSLEDVEIIISIIKRLKTGGK